MKILTTVFILFALNMARAQAEKTYDFSNLDHRSLNSKAIRSKIDSIYSDSIYQKYLLQFDSLARLDEWVKSHYNIQPYLSIDFGWANTPSRFNDLNSVLMGTSFGRVTENVSAFHLSFTVRTKRMIFGYGVEDAFKQNLQTVNSKLKVDGSCFDIYMGYDVLNKPRFQLYPYISIGFNSLYLDLYNADPNSTIQLYSDFLTRYTHTKLQRSTVLMNYALQLDYHLVYSKRRAGIILGVRYGQNTALGKGKWTVNDEKIPFNSDDQFRTSYLLFVLKFYIKVDNGR